MLFELVFKSFSVTLDSHVGLSDVLHTVSKIIIFLVFYFLAILLLIKRVHCTNKNLNSDRKELKNQLKMFVTVSLILLLAFICYGMLNILNFIGLVHSLGPGLRGWITIYMGFAVLINAMLNIFLYLFKHHEIKQCFILQLSNIFPRLKTSKTSVKFLTHNSHPSKNSRT